MVVGDPAVKPLTAACTSFEIELESSGNKALRHYSEHGPYDMVVTGYHHRGLNGVDLALAIRRANPLQRMVVITNESASVVRSLQRKLRDIPVLTGSRCHSENGQSEDRGRPSNGIGASKFHSRKN
jgi:uncharacterized protein with GYD domain